VVDMLRCKGFIANKTSTKYSNTKSECYYLLAEKVNKSELYINCDEAETIIQELQAIERANIDKDTKPSINSKELQKQILGRSPDYADALMMRFWFETNTLQIYY
jgi:phage terminase large subunit